MHKINKLMEEEGRDLKEEYRNAVGNLLKEEREVFQMPLIKYVH